MAFHGSSPYLPASRGASAIEALRHSRGLDHQPWWSWFVPVGWANLPFVTFALVVALATIGLIGVFTSSAAIVAYRENLSNRRVKQAKAEQAQAVPVSQTLADLDKAPAGFDDIFSLPPPPSFHSSSFLVKQLAWCMIGLVALFVLSSIDYHHYSRWTTPMFFVMIALLLAVWAPGIGKTINGANRWVGVGPVGLQPSELAKLVMVIFMANRLANERRRLHSFLKGFVPNVAILGVVAALILKEPDLGATACVGLVVVVMFFCSGMRIWHLSMLGMAALPVVALELLVPFRRARMLAFLDPDRYFHTHAWQLSQSLIAIGSGGTFGQGLGAGPQKYQFLSTAFSDFVYAVLCEETGMIAGFGIPLLFFALFIAGWMIAWRAPDLVGMLIAIGINCMFAISAFIHMFVNTGLVPTKGLTLPFISYGGTSLLINLAAAGVLLNVARQGELHRAQVPEGQTSGGPWLEELQDAPAALAPDDGPPPAMLRLRSRGTTRDIPLPLRPSGLPFRPESN